ncbi:MAG: PolC-type DNA polymerase III [Pelosinus sp.]|nr:PolC-type DNA polymerase III [Pelosinus sp.]
MNMYSIVPDNCKKFLAFAEQLPLAAEYKEVLEKSKVTKIQVDTQNNSWNVFIDVPVRLPQGVLLTLGKSLCDNCGLQKVHFSQTVKDLAVYLKTNWPGFVEHVAKNVQAVRFVLNNAERSFQHNKLSINLVGELAGEMITEHGIAENMRNFIKEEFGAACAVEFTTAPQEVAACLAEDLITPEYLEAVSESSRPREDKAKDNPVIYGRNIKDEPQAIRNVREEARNVVFEGDIAAYDTRELKSGRFLLTFDLSDATDGISAKIFFDEQEKFNKVAGALQQGMRIKVKGMVQFDKFSKDLVLFVDSICRGEKSERMDMAEKPRIELHAHTRMSTMDAVVSVKNLVNTAAKWHHPAIAITDHGVVQAFPEAHDVAAKAGIKVIYGMEGYLFEHDIKSANHIVILAKNPVGLRNLYRLVSLSHLKYFHRTPRLPRQILSEYREGLIFGSACEAGELIRAIISGAADDELLRIASFYDYLEIQPIGNNGFLLREGKVPNEEALRDINRKVCEIGDKLGKLVVATGDVHFLNPEDEVYRRILMAGKGFTDADNQPPLFFHTTDEMLQEFSYLGSDKAFELVVTNPGKITELVEEFKPIPDELYSPQIPGAEEAISSMSYNSAEELYGSPLPDIVADRLKLELDSIINHGFAVLYLIAHKLVKKSLDDGYLVGSRGSVGSSFVATMTNITEVNPLPPHWRCPQCKHSEFITDGSIGGGFDLADKDCPECHTQMEKDGHDIPFAVFMGFHGDKVPDIDLNFSGVYQPVAHKYTEELFGRDNVFRAGTIGTIADKTAYGYVKNYFTEKNIDVRDAYINSVIAGCTGVKRTTGQHPAGIMVVPRDMDVHYFTPIQHPADDMKSGIITTHFDYHSISSRLVKLDILGHDDPTVIKMLEDLTGRDPKTIPFDDQETLSLFSSTKAIDVNPDDLGSTVATYGIPEYGTKFVRQMLVDTTPKTFSELVRISGFSHGTDVWLNNAQDLIREGKAKLSEAISARDDIMMYLIHKGVEPVTAFKIMENVRKGKGVKPDEVEKMKAKNVPDWYVESCQKIKYMFPKAHAVAYVMMAFRIAYCKVHYPLAFYAAYFTVRATDFDAELIVQGQAVVKAQLKEFEQRGNNLSVKEKSLQTILEIALEMYLRGFTFQHVDLYKSAATDFIIEGSSLLPPLAGLQGLGDNAAKSIVEAREEKPFATQEDIKVRARATKTVIDILKQHGCLDDLPETAQIMLFA